MLNPFQDCYFLGYINEVTPQYVNIHFPSSKLLQMFTHAGDTFGGGNVGNYVVIEGEEFGFLARIIQVSLPDSERNSISERAIATEETRFHPSGKAEILLNFSLYNPQISGKTISKFPPIGAKAYSCSEQLIGRYVKNFGSKSHAETAFANIGKLISGNTPCIVSINSLFGRHCAVVGTTGSGKSYTVSVLIEEMTKNTSNKIILIDATGEYVNHNSENTTLGQDTYFPYQSLTIPDIFFLLRPTVQSQRPILLEAMRTLKWVHLFNKINGTNLTTFQKANKSKNEFLDFYRQHISEIESNNCDFNINYLISQIKEECVYQTSFNDTSKWGAFDPKIYDYQTTLITRISDLLNSKEFNSLFGFSDVRNDKKPLPIKFEEFYSSSETVFRINFEGLPSSFSSKEIVANSIGLMLLNKARNRKFKQNPVTLFIDEAHQFINKAVKDEFFETQTLESFDLIAKEGRKYGLFICLATQMPRDIPVGTLSQMGTFIVHRLINDFDKKAIENACSSINRDSISFLPVLGAGEAILVGVDFPMPLSIKIRIPDHIPDSYTPQLK